MGQVVIKLSPLARELAGIELVSPVVRLLAIVSPLVSLLGIKVNAMFLSLCAC